jgi:hypothetical protein
LISTSIVRFIFIAAFISTIVIIVDEMIIANIDAIATSISLSNTKVNNASSTLTVVSDVKRADCPPLQVCPGPRDISYIVTTSNDTNSVEREFIGQQNGTHLTIQPGEFKINVLPAKSVGLGWEYVNSTFSGDCRRGQDKDNGYKGNNVSIQGMGSIGTGETQKCTIQNYYETYPGYKDEEKIQDDKLKN